MITIEQSKFERDPANFMPGPTNNPKFDGLAPMQSRQELGMVSNIYAAPSPRSEVSAVTAMTGVHNMP